MPCNCVYVRRDSIHHLPILSSPRLLLLRSCQAGARQRCFAYDRRQLEEIRTRYSPIDPVILPFCDFTNLRFGGFISPSREIYDIRSSGCTCANSYRYVCTYCIRSNTDLVAYSDVSNFRASLFVLFDVSSRISAEVVRELPVLFGMCVWGVVSSDWRL